MYDYDHAASILTITFREPLSVNEKVALDTLVNIYVDSTILTPEDILSFKNLHAYKSLDQSLPGTLNTITDVTFKSTSIIDRVYYQMASNSKYIFIQKPGTYLVVAKVGAHLEPGSVPGSNSVLQWSLSYDDTRTGVFYITIPNTSVYTLHTNTNSMTDSTLLTCVFTVNSSSGTYLRTSVRRTLGNTPLTIDSDQTSISIMSIPGASYYEGNMTTSLSLGTVGAPNVTVKFNNDRILQYPFAHIPGSSDVTVSQNGYVLYLSKSTINKTSGTDTSSSKTILVHNSAPVENVGSNSGTLSAASNRTSSHFMGIIKVNSGDILSLQGKIEQGSNIQFTAGETGLILMYIHPSLFKSLSSTFVSTNTNSTSLSTSPTDIIFNTTPVLVPPSTALSVTGSTVTVDNPGIYLLVSNVTVNNSSGIVRECGTYSTNSVDMGKSYYLSSGSLSIKQLNANGRTTISNMSLLSLPNGAKVKVQVSTNGTTADNIVATDTSQLTIVSFCSWNQSIKSSKVFGDNYNNITSLDDLLITNATLTEKCRLIYHQMTNGVYRFTTNFCVTTTAATTSLNIQLIDIHSNSSNTFIIYNKTITQPAGTFYFSTIDVTNVADGAHQFVLSLSSPNGVPLVVNNAIIDCWRVI